ncbi:unnamed protein product [Heligmosomoides polygyrus]|uniref:Uncharacterized protein n=1 Tax=Heligmosomoides polygyrus TaxID=6339 RepID=A0A183FMN2_HELPZ|nr:unnamed protein product [Heligmosomoides polygyrus]
MGAHADGFTFIQKTRTFTTLTELGKSSSAGKLRWRFIGVSSANARPNGQLRVGGTQRDVGQAQVRRGDIVAKSETTATRLSIPHRRTCHRRNRPGLESQPSTCAADREDLLGETEDRVEEMSTWRHFRSH